MFILSLCTVCVSLLLLLLLQSHASTTERNLFGRGCLKPIRLFSPKFCGRGSAERRLRSLIIRLIGNKYQIRELQAVFRSGGFRLFMVLFVVVNVFFIVGFAHLLARETSRKGSKPASGLENVSSCFFVFYRFNSCPCETAEPIGYG